MTYPTRLGPDGAVRYIGPSGYGWPTIEKLERYERDTPTQHESGGVSEENRP